MGVRRHIQTQSEWEYEKANQILEYVQSDLYMAFPFMGIALRALEAKEVDELQTFATDGACICFSSNRMLTLFQKNLLFLERAYFHTVLHCVFSHLWIRGDRDPRLWNVACDIAVEYSMDQMEEPVIKRTISWIRQDTYASLRQLSGVSAATIYYWLLLQEEEKQRQLAREFYTDDHRLWPLEEKQKGQAASQAQQNWNKIARQTAMEQKRRDHGEREQQGREALAAQLKAARSQKSYREFLQKFTVLREEIHEDPDAFDPGYYSYGLRLYGNLPLIESLESREVKKIREFVIVVDTSYSTSGELIKNFLKETYTILSDADSFFQKSRIHIIQCDEVVQRDQLVQSAAEMERVMNSFTIVGGGGTDFRPAFSYVEELLREGQIRNLSGLLYFTDGKGIYPVKRPSYRTAFLYLEEYDEERVPAWAIRMRIFPEEFEVK